MSDINTDNIKLVDEVIRIRKQIRDNPIDDTVAFYVGYSVYKNEPDKEYWKVFREYMFSHVFGLEEIRVIDIGNQKMYRLTEEGGIELI